MKTKQEKKKANFEFYIEFGDNNPINMGTLSQEKRNEIGIKLNDVALRAIGYIPDESA